MRKLTIAAATIAAAVAAGPALAQDNPEGLYLGAGLGDFSADVEGLESFDDADLDFDADEDATKFFGGWRFNPFLAVQLDYSDFGESRAVTDVLSVRSDTTGITPSVVGTLPIGPVELYGRVGVMFYDVEIDTPVGELLDESGEDAVIATGIGLTLFERLSLKAEYERIDIDALDDADAAWVTAAWRF